MSNHMRYILKRSIITVILIYVIITLLFFMFRFMPGSYIDVVAQGVSDPDVLAAVREKFGLGAPLHVQYYRYIVSLLTGDAGISFAYQEPVWSVVKLALVNSFILVTPGIIVGYLIGGYIGSYMAMFREKARERGLYVFATLCGTIPEFFTSILLLIAFSQLLGIFPSSGMVSVDTPPEVRENYLLLFQRPDFWMHYTLPFLAVVIRSIYAPSLVMRTSVMEVRGQDFLYYIRLLGLPRSHEMRSLVRHASIPVITGFPSSMTRAIGGMVLVEVVFNWPGIGFLLVQSILFRDFPVVQFIFFLTATWVVLANFSIDILYSFIDPRITFEGER